MNTYSSHVSHLDGTAVLFGFLSFPITVFRFGFFETFVVV